MARRLLPTMRHNNTIKTAAGTFHWNLLCLIKKINVSSADDAAHRCGVHVNGFEYDRCFAALILVIQSRGGLENRVT